METDTIFDCDFTLALNNRTGKFFFCKEMIESSRDLIPECLYWRIPMTQLPQRTLARILGRLARWEVDLRTGSRHFNRYFPPTFRHRPTIFTDPRETVFYQLKQHDVVLCHDMGPITHPDLYDPGVSRIYEQIFRQIHRAKPFMLFVSEASRHAFMAIYGDDYPLMQTIHPPLRVDMKHTELRVIEGIPPKFLLTVGSIGKRKNQLQAIKAFELSELAKSGYAYVICGGLEPGAEIVVDLARRTPGVILPGYVDDAGLRWLYRNATGFVLPSLLEGFGLPAAEAISYGLVPLLAGGGALQEVAGDGAIYVNPLDEAEIAAGMLMLANLTQEQRKHRIEQSIKSIDRFSLENAVGKWRIALMLAAKASSKTS
jgi:glycosyltransferase involved in cell wall biosynthesis